MNVPEAAKPAATPSVTFSMTDSPVIVMPVAPATRSITLAVAATLMMVNSNESTTVGVVANSADRIAPVGGVEFEEVAFLFGGKGSVVWHDASPGSAERAMDGQRIGPLPLRPQGRNERRIGIIPI